MSLGAGARSAGQCRRRLPGRRVRAQSLSPCSPAPFAGCRCVAACFADRLGRSLLGHLLRRGAPGRGLRRRLAFSARLLRATFFAALCFAAVFVAGAFLAGRPSWRPSWPGLPPSWPGRFLGGLLDRRLLAPSATFLRGLLGRRPSSPAPLLAWPRPSWPAPRWSSSAAAFFAALFFAALFFAALFFAARLLRGASSARRVCLAAVFLPVPSSQPRLVAAFVAGFAVFAVFVAAASRPAWSSPAHAFFAGYRADALRRSARPIRPTAAIRRHPFRADGTQSARVARCAEWSAQYMRSNGGQLYGHDSPNGASSRAELRAGAAAGTATIARIERIDEDE